MTAKQKFRMTLDLTMTVLSLILMGGNYFFPWDGVHEVLGVALLVLWAVHVWLNHGFYKSLFKGKYNAFRVLQAVINVGILLCALLLMVSGIMLSNYVFAFLGIEFGTDFARTAHLLSSHWYFVFMSLHIGMHVGVIVRQVADRKSERSERAVGIGTASEASSEVKVARPVVRSCGTPTTKTEECSRKAEQWKARPDATRLGLPIAKIFPKILLALVCAYGVYAFVVRNIGKYLLFLQPFFFFDVERGYVLFFVDYVCIMAAIAAAGFYLSEWAKNAARK